MCHTDVKTKILGSKQSALGLGFYRHFFREISLIYTEDQQSQNNNSKEPKPRKNSMPI